MSDGKKSVISKKDILILQKLLENGRKSSSSISKEINLGREIVNYRIKRLIKENLIVKFVPKLNKKALNYQEYIILLKLNLKDGISKEKFIKEQIGNKYLKWTIKSENGWDLIIRLYSRNLEEFKLKLEEILNNFSKVLTDYYTIISSDEIKENEKEIILKELFNFENKNKDFSIIKTDSHQFDEKDKEILDLLEENGREQYKQISEKLNVSSDTIKYRIDKMKNSGLIVNFHPILNLNKLGYKTFAVILKFKFLSIEEEKKVNKFILEINCISKAIKSLNSQEYFLNLILKKEQEKIDFEKKFSMEFKHKIRQIEFFKIN